MTHNKLNIKWLLLLPLLLLSGFVSAQNKLNEYLLFAAQNNPELKAAFAEYLAALEKAPQVRALPDPTLAFAYFIQPVETRVGPQQFKITASQMFPWFGSLSAKEDVALQHAKARYELFLEQKSLLSNEVKQAYFNLYVNRRAIRIIQSNIDLLLSMQKIATIKVESGQVSAVDEYRIELELNELHDQLLQLHDQEQVSLVKLNKLLNTDSQKAVLTPDTLWSTDFTYTKAQVWDSVQTKNHKLQRLTQTQHALLAQQTVVRKQGMPSFGLGFDYTFVGTGPNNMPGTDAIVFPTVAITIPLYRKKYDAMAKEVLQQQEANHQEQLSIKNKLETAFETAWAAYADATRRVALYTRQHQLAQQANSLLETEYATGTTPFQELLRIERKLLKYNLALEQARADKQAAISNLHYLMGNE